MHLAICAIFRNEAPYLREWIEFHRLVGVENFYLYENRSDDNYMAAIRSYVSEGVVQLIDWPRKPPCHIQAYEDFISRHRGKPWWVAFLDCDEFLFSPCHATIGEALEAVALPAWGAVGVNWMCFGSSGAETQAPGPVIERFTMRPADSFGPNRHIKSIVRMDRVAAAGGNPHFFQVTGGVFNENGDELTSALSSLPAHSRLRINHYHTKCREEYLRRIALGKADGGAKRSPSEYDLYQAAEIDDRAIWRFLPELRKGLDRPFTTARPAEPDTASRGFCAEIGLLPRTFAGYRNLHDAETMLICGCGASLPTMVAPERLTTIGVNDVGRIFDPDYLVVINPRNQFTGDRFRFVEDSRAQAVFSQLDLGITHPNQVRFRLGKRGGTDLSDLDTLPYTRNSPYVALCLAVYMGARRIGLIGVDFTDHHFFAPTGRHPLAREINQINREYEALAESCRRLGVEVFNLSAESRLTAFPKINPEQFARRSLVPAEAARAVSGSKVFFVNYRFLSCGEVFSDGLRNATEDLGMQSSAAPWDDVSLGEKIRAFTPDLLFVVHGRNFARRWKSERIPYRSAVWLLDEPYEVDDTSRFARLFDAVFVNDPSTLHRHKNAHYLPVCYDPAVYSYRPGPRQHQVGFIGGANPAREAMLGELARRSLLSYVVGGPWRSTELRHLSPSVNIPAEETARLYQQTRIVLNVFRTAHHFNREQIPAVSMNPRIYEALACGALVVSERREEIERLCPEMPVFNRADEMVSIIEGLLADPHRFESVRKACIRRLAGHTYAHRLYTAFTFATGVDTRYSWNASSAAIAPAPIPIEAGSHPESARKPPDIPGWMVDPACVEAVDGILTLRAYRRPAPASETGLISTEAYSDIALSFEFETQPGATFIAKIHQIDQCNQASNSYHLMVTGASAYLARHDHIFHSFTLATNAWHFVALTWNRGRMRLLIDGKTECEVNDALLSAGFCSLGIKSGAVRIRNIQAIALAVEEPAKEEIVPTAPCYRLLHDLGSDLGSDSSSQFEPVVSIVTTVYDRTECLDACLRSVGALTFDRYEHIIVADAPPDPVVTQLRSLIAAQDNGRHRMCLAVLASRANDMGVTPAATGLSLARGKYVCFLSDDNGYKPGHFEKLVAALDEDAELGFAYSGCLYGGRFTLNIAPPSLGRIDLGQPLFRRSLFALHQVDQLPFIGRLWDWQLIERFLRNGVRWKHVKEPTFIFRLAKYPHLIPPKRRAGGREIAAPDPLKEAPAGPAIPHVQAPLQNNGLMPFTATPRRNLIYHVWPVRGSMWRWNIDQLKERIDLFNGVRLISIVHDHRTDNPAEVEAALRGHGCEFIIAPNHPTGESITFPRMLRRVASQDINEVTFYAHAKGVRHEPNVPQTLRRWAELNYQAGLDDWAQVRAQLERFALTGSFRRFGRFDSHRRMCDWHYHGTFFWLRHARVFAKNCFDVPQFYCGVETWPGMHFTREESGCILFDDVQRTALSEEFWKLNEQEIERWTAERSLAEAAAAPNQPLAFDGCEWPRISLHPDEFDWFLTRLATTLSRSVLVIGSGQGGVEWHIARRFRDLRRDIQIKSLQSSPAPETLACLEDARRRFGQQISVVDWNAAPSGGGNSGPTQADAVFIDNDKSYLGCSRDFQLALSVCPRIVGIYKIADSEWHARTRCGVPRLWPELRPQHASEEMVAADWGGIGILRMNGVNF
jgi:spore maturation protein CgeB